MPVQTVYIDVTSTCRSPMNTGVQRIGRGLCRSLPRCLPTIPVMWSKMGRRYVVVKAGTEEDVCLRNPFASGAAMAASSGRQTSLRTPWRRLARSFREMTAPTPDRTAFVSGACWLQPEIFMGRRTSHWAGRKRSTARAVAIFYDAAPLHDPSWVEGRFQEKFVAYMKTLDRFSTVVAISAESAADLRSFWSSQGIAGTDVRVEGLPCDFASAARNPTPNEAGARILVVATLEPRKNHAVFLDACEILWREGAAFSVELVGRCPRETGAPALDRIAAAQESGRPLDWRRHVSDGELVECYRRCSFTVYPSLKEGFGLPILESLWYGRPCVCGSNGALGEAASGGGCITVDQHDPVSLASAMRTLLSNRDVSRRLYGEALHRDFRTWDNYAAAIASILCEPKQTDAGTETR